MTEVRVICPTCESVWREATDEYAGAAVVRCPSCAKQTTLLEAAAAAWALGHISREDFFEVAGHVAPEDVGQALAALVNIAAWWERRTTGLESE